MCSSILKLLSVVDHIPLKKKWILKTNWQKKKQLWVHLGCEVLFKMGLDLSCYAPFGKVSKSIVAWCCHQGQDLHEKLDWKPWPSNGENLCQPVNNENKPFGGETLALLSSLLWKQIMGQLQSICFECRGSWVQSLASSFKDLSYRSWSIWGPRELLPGKVVSTELDQLFLYKVVLYNFLCR